MRLEKLELYGFKSFADRTELVLQPGLTAFIGPNGCGKSNVVDGVKWVLGEQSVKALRGNEMQDVIFNGTPTRRSMGYAEATLTLSNTKGLLPTDFETVSVTRRLYRSGESEYFLNKQRCRLRDIRELFMGTGIGMDAYSVIEQGKVDVLLTSNKQDRRAIFEEAAGISRYKAQKKVCLSKLERVENNLLRLGDIIDEVEKRTRSVRYQAAKARRWKKLEEEKRELAIALAMHQYDLLVKERDTTAAELAKLSAEAEGLQASIERVDAEVAALETAVIEADRRIAELQSEDVRISAQLQAAEGAAQLNERRVAELTELEESAKANIAKTEATIELMRGELTRTGAECSAIEQAVAAGLAELEQRRAGIKELEERLRGLRERIEAERGQALDLASERARCNNELSAVTAQREQLVRHDQRLEQRTAEHKKTLAEYADRRRQLAVQAEELAARIATLGAERQVAEREREDAEHQLADIADRVQSTRSEMASVDSRRELLADLERKLEGLGGGVRILLEAAVSKNPQVAGVCGLVADAIEVDLPHAAAVEAAFGPYDQLIVVESSDALARAMDFLRQAEGGKTALLSLDAVTEDPPDAAVPAGEMGVVGRAIDLVRHAAAFARPLRCLIGDVLVVRDLETARRLAASDGKSARYATLDGELLNPRGISLGGQNRGGAGVISRRSECRALEVRRATLEADLAVLDKQRAELGERQAAARARIDELAAQTTDVHAQLGSVHTETSNLDSLVQRLEAELRTTESERAEIVSQLDELSSRESQAREAAAQLEGAERELRTAVADQEALLRAGETERDAARTRLTELEVSRAQQLEKAESLRRRIAEITAGIADHEKNLDAARAQAEQCVARRGEAVSTINAKRAEIQALLDRRGRLGSEKAEAANGRELVRVQFQSKHDERGAAAHRLKEAEVHLNKLNVHATEVGLRIENLEERSHTEHACSLAERHQQAPVEERDWQQIAQEIESLEQKMRAMGAVNTYAIEELDELERRAAELGSQRDDLRKADETLKEIIRKINRRSRELFEKTFNDVRENFQVLFRKLFGGGHADVVLEPDVDVLDAGIDVIACPPGKEPTSITLLSGGEKAMTAVALLFAIFRSKPSPFCILDEVDAALDESNIERFCMMVREFLKDSQFLVVTHNRRTMSMADALYGITMQEPGVSTKVSVKFSDEAEAKVA